MKSTKLTTLELYSYTIGGVIGSGLFILLPIAIGLAGKGAIFAMIMGVLLAFFAQLFNFIIASMFPLKGGDYSQMAFLMPPVVSGIYGFLWLIASLTMAGYATSAISYTSSVITSVPSESKLLSIGIITLFFGISYFGTKFGGKVESAMTVILLGALLLFVIMGLPKINFSKYISEGGFFDCGFSNFAAACNMCLYAVLGCTLVPVSLSSELKRPTREAPKAMIGCSLIVLVISTLIVFVATGVLPIEQVANKDLSVVAQYIFPKGVFVAFILCGAVLALLTSLFTSVTTFHYPIMQMADEGWIPPVFKKKAKNGWPYVSMTALYLITLIPIIFNISFDTIVSLTNLVFYIIIFFAVVKCMALPKKYPEPWKCSFLHAMPIPVYYIFCSVGLIACAYMIYGSCAGQSFGFIIASFATILIVAVYVIWRLKVKAVSIEYLKSQKQKVIEEALSYKE